MLSSLSVKALRSEPQVIYHEDTTANVACQATPGSIAEPSSITGDGLTFKSASEKQIQEAYSKTEKVNTQEA